jgi:DNA-binding transcriptional LysR family regulator
MDLWQLHVFVSVVEAKSFSKASEAINLSQPTVSSHIKELEEQFGCKLLDRLGKTTEPTRAGSILYDHAKRLLSLRDQAESDIHDFLGNIKGDILVGGSTIPSGYIIPRLLGPFLKDYPDVNVELKTGDTQTVIQQIIDGEIEAGIVGARKKHPAILQEELILDTMKAVVPEGHPWFKRNQIDADQLIKEPMIAREKGSGTWQSILNSLESAGLSADQLNIKVTMGNTVSVIQGIKHGMGVSILSTLAVQDDLDTGRLWALTVKGLDLHRFFYLTLPSKRIISPICSKLISFFRSECSDKQV